MAVLFDWSDAYGNVVHNKLLKLLINLDFPYSFIIFITSFLTDRCIYVQVNQSRGELSCITKSLPQEFQVAHVSFGLYADDLIIWKSGKDISLHQSLIQQDIRLVQKRSLSFGFPASISKTKAIIFTNGTTAPPNPLTIFSREIPYCNSVKLLGLCMDSKLQWHEHISSLKPLIILRLCILKRFARNKRGCHPYNYIEFYRTIILDKLYIFSNIEYGIQFFSALPPSSLKIFESLQNSSIRIALGVHKRTPLS